MFTRKALDRYIHSFLTDLSKEGYTPARVMLFGSYAYGRPTETSDIDLAIWDEHFTGCGSEDIVPIASLISKYPSLELHTFSVDDQNPFAEEVMKKGILIQSPIYQM